MKYALIGCGRIAVNHMKAVLENHLELVAVCDLQEERMEQLLAKFEALDSRGVARYTDYRKMLAEHPEIELAAIATSSGAHAEIAMDLIERGVSVIIEKPIAMSMTDADRIVALSREKHVVVSACHQNRFNLAVQQARKALEAGRFGRLSHGSIHVRWNRNKAYYEQAAWRGTWAEDGGCLMNQCIHGIDILRWMMGGEADTVYGMVRQQQHPYLEAEDIGMAVVSFKNGAIATIEGTTNVYPSNLEEALLLFGDKGTVKLGGKSINTVEVWDFADSDAADTDAANLEEQTVNVYGNGHSRLYADVIDAMRTNRSPYVDAVAGRNALELVLAIYKSAKTGMPVSLPLKEFSSVDMIGAFQNE